MNKFGFFWKPWNNFPPLISWLWIAENKEQNPKNYRCPSVDLLSAGKQKVVTEDSENKQLFLTLAALLSFYLLLIRPYFLKKNKAWTTTLQYIYSIKCMTDKSENISFLMCFLFQKKGQCFEPALEWSLDFIPLPLRTAASSLGHPGVQDPALSAV